MDFGFDGGTALITDGEGRIGNEDDSGINLITDGQ